MTGVGELERDEWRARCEAAGIGAAEPAWTGRLLVPLWFDPSIGYWTGEPDWECVVAALERFLRRVEAEEVEARDRSATASLPPGAWLPAGASLGPVVLIRGRVGVWLAQLLPESAVRMAAKGDAAAEVLRRWAQEEGLELVSEGDPCR